MHIYKRLWILLLLLLSLGGLSCDESLPPRNDPPQVLAYSLAVHDGIVPVRNGLPSGLVGGFETFARNVYNEVLSDTQRIQFRIDITMRDQPENQATVIVDRQNLTNAFLLSGQILTVGIDTACHLYAYWNQHTNEGKPFWSFVKSSPGRTSSGEPYLASDPIVVVVSASVQVFKKVQPYHFPPTEYTFVYWVF